MANLAVLDAAAATVYLKENGAGTNLDPHIGIHAIDQTTPGTTNGVVINSGTVTTVTTVSAVTAVGTITPGVAATSLGKAEDAQHASGDVGVMAMAVRNDTQAALAAHDNDYSPIACDGTGTLFSRVTSIVPGVTATSLGKAEDAQHASGDVGVMAMAVRADTAVALAAHDNDYAPLEVDATGHLHVAQMASEVHLGAVGGKTVTVTVTPALSVAGAYAANDFVGTDHTGMTFANATRINAGSGVIESAVLIDYALQSAACELWLFDVTPAGLPNDNDAFTITDAAALTCIGVIPFSTYYASALNSVSVAKGLGIAFTAVGAVDDIYGVLVTRGTPTYANGDISIRLQIMQD